MQDQQQEKIIVIRTSKLLGAGLAVGAFGLWHAHKIHGVFRTLRLVRRGY